MLNNNHSDSTIVNDFISILRNDTDISVLIGTEHMDDDDLIEEMVDTRDTIEHFRAAAFKFGLEKRELNGIEYWYGLLKRSEYKNSGIELVLMEKDGWTLSYAI